MFVFRFTLLLTVSLGTQAIAQSLPITRPTEFGYAVFDRPKAIDANKILSTFRQQVANRIETETYFATYLYGLKRNAKKLLSPEQTEKLTKLIEARSVAQQRWHDERNMLRCAYEKVLWSAAADDKSYQQARPSLQKWMSLRMAWTQQEEMHRWQTTSQLWDILTPQQRTHVKNGEWKKYVKLTTGHTRGDFLQKKLTRALGRSNDSEKFQIAMTEWSSKREPIHQVYLDARDTVVLAGFHHDVSTPAIMFAAVNMQNAAYSRLYLAEAEQLLDLVNRFFPNARAKCQDNADKIWNEALAKYEHCGEVFFQRIQNIQ